MVFYQTEYYNKQGRLHREDGPAVETPTGTREWWVNGHRHRISGPAIVYSGGTREWWIEGKKLSEEEFYNNYKRRTEWISFQKTQQLQ